MRRTSTRGAGSTRAQDYLRELPDRVIADRYDDAVHELADVPFLAEQFEDAFQAAIFHCEKAKIAKRLGFAEDKMDRRTWNTVNTAALKLKITLAELNGVGVLRLIDANPISKGAAGTNSSFSATPSLSRSKAKVVRANGICRRAYQNCGAEPQADYVG